MTGTAKPRERLHSLGRVVGIDLLAPLDRPQIASMMEMGRKSAADRPSEQCLMHCLCVQSKLFPSRLHVQIFPPQTAIQPCFAVFAAYRFRGSDLLYNGAPEV